MIASLGELLPSVGWVATAVFTASYFARRAETLRYLQMVGALLWLIYGVAISAPPVIVANALLLGAAAWTARRPRGAVAPGGADASTR
ncbi:MAG: YgjV family protein [Gemmatimonadota bacterium]